jgi:hypothetical protein
MRENVVRSDRRFGMWFGVVLPFAHFGVPVMLIITRIPFSAACDTRSSRSERW